MAINFNDLQYRNAVGGNISSDYFFTVGFVKVNDDKGLLTESGIATAIANYVASVYPTATISKTHTEPESTSL